MYNVHKCTVEATNTREGYNKVVYGCVYIYGSKTTRARGDSDNIVRVNTIDNKPMYVSVPIVIVVKPPACTEMA